MLAWKETASLISRLSLSLHLASTVESKIFRAPTVTVVSSILDMNGKLDSLQNQFHILFYDEAVSIKQSRVEILFPHALRLSGNSLNARLAALEEV